MAGSGESGIHAAHLLASLDKAEDATTIDAKADDKELRKAWDILASKKMSDRDSVREAIAEAIKEHQSLTEAGFGPLLFALLGEASEQNSKLSGMGSIGELFLNDGYDLDKLKAPAIGSAGKNENKPDPAAVAEFNARIQELKDQPIQRGHFTVDVVVGDMTGYGDVMAGAKMAVELSSLYQNQEVWKEGTVRLRLHKDDDQAKKLAASILAGSGVVNLNDPDIERGEPEKKDHVTVSYPPHNAEGDFKIQRYGYRHLEVDDDYGSGPGFGSLGALYSDKPTENKIRSRALHRTAEDDWDAQALRDFSASLEARAGGGSSSQAAESKPKASKTAGKKSKKANTSGGEGSSAAATPAVTITGETALKSIDKILEMHQIDPISFAYFSQFGGDKAYKSFTENAIKYDNTTVAGRGEPKSLAIVFSKPHESVRGVAQNMLDKSLADRVWIYTVGEGHSFATPELLKGRSSGAAAKASGQRDASALATAERSVVLVEMASGLSNLEMRDMYYSSNGIVGATGDQSFVEACRMQSLRARCG